MQALMVSKQNLTHNDVTSAIHACGLNASALRIQLLGNAACITSKSPNQNLVLLGTKPLKIISQECQIDINPIDVSLANTDFKVLAMDMDSTVITIECIDEIADYCGCKAEVAAITEATMRGEIQSFSESLIKRVALLKNTPVTALQAVYDERLKLSPGVESLLQSANQHNIHSVLVSGGFTFFSEKLKPRLGFSETRANTLEIENNQLTGRVTGHIIDAQAKADTVLNACQMLNCQPSQTITVGDGANDLLMMSVAGLSVAYKAKPSVQAKAQWVLNYSGLDVIQAVWQKPSF